jgi:hypothetical protein
VIYSSWASILYLPACSLNADFDLFQVLQTLESRAFWSSLEGICKLLKPFTEAIMAIQSDRSYMADVARYWIYLARMLRMDLPKFGLPSGESHVTVPKES